MLLRDIFNFFYLVIIYNQLNAPDILKLSKKELSNYCRGNVT